MNKALMLLLLLSVSACTADEAPVEEPVQSSPMEDAGNTAEDSESMDDGAAAEPAQEAPMAAPAPTPPAAATGGIISSGTNAAPQEKCKALETAAERKKCQMKLKRKGR